MLTNDWSRLAAPNNCYTKTNIFSNMFSLTSDTGGERLWSKTKFTFYPTLARMMYVCIGKGGCRTNRRRSPQYGDMVPVSPSKIKQKRGKKMEDYSALNGNYPSPDDSRTNYNFQGDFAANASVLSLDVNDNHRILRSPSPSKSTTLPRRSHGKTPPQKPPRGLPPKPPRLMERKLFTCENPTCQKQEELLGIVALDFKSCPSCFTHYCCIECRKAHWNEHRVVCHYGQVDSHIKSIINMCNENRDLLYHLTEIAREGFIAKGRGAVMLILLSPKAAELFIKSGVEYFRNPRNTPTFSSYQELKDAGVYSKHQKMLLGLLNSYCPAQEMILNIAVVVGKNLPKTPIPRNKEPAVISQVKVPFTNRKASRTFSPQNSQDFDICTYNARDNARRKSF